MLPDSPRVRTALTHRSAAATVSESNERLEFLGDALLSAFVARFLLESLPAETDEGTLSRARTRIVRRETLAKAARDLGLVDKLVMGAGERKDNRQTFESPLADAYEALIGAIFLDSGYEAAELFVQETLEDALRDVAQVPSLPDPKTALQIRLQAVGRGLPRYAILAEKGTGQDIVFTAAVYAADSSNPLGMGEGTNKRAAQTEAAKVALEALA